MLIFYSVIRYKKNASQRLFEGECKGFVKKQELIKKRLGYQKRLQEIDEALGKKERVNVEFEEVKAATWFRESGL